MADLTYASDDEPKGVVRGFFSGGLNGGLKGALIGGLFGAGMVGLGVVGIGVIGATVGATFVGTMGAIAMPAAFVAGLSGIAGAISGAAIGTPTGSVLGAFSGHAAGQRFERQAAMREKLATLGLASQGTEFNAAAPQPVAVASVPTHPVSVTSPSVVADTTVKLPESELANQGLRPIGVNGERSEGHVGALLASGYQQPIGGSKVDALAERRTRAPETQAQVG